MRRRRDALLDFRVTASCVVIAAVRRAKRLASLSLPRGQCQVSRRSELTAAQRSQSHLRKDWRLVHHDTAIRQIILVLLSPVQVQEICCEIARANLRASSFNSCRAAVRFRALLETFLGTSLIFLARRHLRRAAGGAWKAPLCICTMHSVSKKE